MKSSNAKSIWHGISLPIGLSYESADSLAKSNYSICNSLHVLCVYSAAVNDQPGMSPSDIVSLNAHTRSENTPRK